MNQGDDRIYDSEVLSSSNWQGFVYLSGTSNRSDAPLEPRNQTSIGMERVLEAAILPLSRKRAGDRIHIVSLNCGEANNRLMGMGLIAGAVLDIVSCTTTGSVIVALHDQRLGLSAEMANKILVADAEQARNGKLNSSTVGMVTMQTTSEMATLSEITTASEIETVKLRDAAIGSTLRVIGYEPTARDYKRKLLAMGLTPGTEVRVNRHAPLGDPTEITVRGFQLSLRKAEADALIVTPVSRS
jgi:ferrous iron transport protein A